MKSFFILLTVAVFSATAYSQSAEDSVKSVVNNMFIAMKNVDVNLLRSCFADSVVFQTIGRNKAGELVVRNEGKEWTVQSLRCQFIPARPVQRYMETSIYHRYQDAAGM